MKLDFPIKTFFNMTLNTFSIRIHIFRVRISLNIESYMCGNPIHKPEIHSEQLLHSGETIKQQTCYTLDGWVTI